MTKNALPPGFLDAKVEIFADLLRAPLAPMMDEMADFNGGTVAERAAAIPGGTIRVWVEFIPAGSKSFFSY